VRKAMQVVALIVLAAGIIVAVMILASQGQDRQVQRESGAIAHEAGSDHVAVMEINGHWYIGIDAKRTNSDQRQSIRGICRQHLWTGRIIEFTSP
jgi:hypothetical protein